MMKIMILKKNNIRAKHRKCLFTENQFYIAKVTTAPNCISVFDERKQWMPFSYKFKRWSTDHYDEIFEVVYSTDIKNKKELNTIMKNLESTTYICANPELIEPFKEHIWWRYEPGSKIGNTELAYGMGLISGYTVFSMPAMTKEQGIVLLPASRKPINIKI